MKSIVQCLSSSLREDHHVSHGVDTNKSIWNIDSSPRFYLRKYNIMFICRYVYIRVCVHKHSYSLSLCESLSWPPLHISSGLPTGLFIYGHIHKPDRMETNYKWLIISYDFNEKNLQYHNRNLNKKYLTITIFLNLNLFN